MPGQRKAGLHIVGRHGARRARRAGRPAAPAAGPCRARPPRPTPRGPISARRRRGRWSCPWPRRRPDRGRSPAPPAAPAPSARPAPATPRGRRGSPARTASPRTGWDGDRARAAAAASAAMEVSAASAAASSISGAAKPLRSSTVKWPRLSASRAFQSASTWLPICRTGRSLRERPPCTRPRCRPCCAREQLEHGAGLAVRPHAQDHAFVGPLHDRGCTAHCRVTKAVPAIVTSPPFDRPTSLRMSLIDQREKRS